MFDTPRPDPTPVGSAFCDAAARNDWQSWFAAARARRPVLEVLDSHPNHGLVPPAFSVGSYLSANVDVALAGLDFAAALFHYLEFGLAEGRGIGADRWQPEVVAAHHGVCLGPGLSRAGAIEALLNYGVARHEIVLSEQDLWESQGIAGPQMSALFNPEFYLAQLDALDGKLPAPDRVSALRDYLSRGLEVGLPPGPDHGISPGYYRAALAEQGEVAPEKSANLQRHWAQHGLRRGVFPNPAAHLTGLSDVPLPARLATRLGAPKAVVEFMEKPSGLDLADPDDQALLVGLARWHGQNGRTDIAKTMLFRVLDRHPDDPRAALDLADLLGGGQDHALERRLRRKVPAKFDSGANRIALAELELRQNNPSAALQALSQVPPDAQGDVALRTRARLVARAVIDAIWADLGAAIDLHDVDGVQRLLTQALGLYAPTPEPIPRARPIQRVAILANDDLYQCMLYRADQKRDQLVRAGISAQVFVQSRDIDRLYRLLDQFDAVIFQRNPAFPPIIELMLEAARQGLVTCYDIDDLIFDASHFPPPLETYAGQISARQHAEIACGVPMFAAAARLCQIGIASTPAIAKALAPIMPQGRVILHRNGFGQAHLTARPRRRAKGEKLVLFYGSGTKAHKAAFRDMLEPALAKVLADNPGRVEVRLMGEFPDLTHLDPTHEDVKILPPVWDLEVYLEELSQSDIALSVLEKSVAADAKSELKWTEPALFGIPAIVSPTATMAEVIEEGVTGLLAADLLGFERALARLIEDTDLRQSIGAAARARVLRDYDTEAMGRSLVAKISPSLPAADARPIRLLIVNVFFPPQDIGGATRVVWDNVDYLRRTHGDRFEIDVITTLEGGSGAFSLQTTSHSGVRIWSITAADGVDESAMRHPVMDRKIAELIDRIAPDIAHVHCVQRMGAGVIDACRHRGVPYVLTLHDGWWTSPHQFLLGPDGRSEMYDFSCPAPPLPERAQIARRCLMDAAALLTVSEPFAEIHRRIGLVHIECLENGISPLPDPPPHRPDPTGRVRLAHIGGASRHKGYELVRAALLSRSYLNLSLTVIDHGLPMGVCRRETWNGTPVTFRPRVPQARIADLFSEIDVLLAPSIWAESYGLVSREALALGRWVVASDRGAIGADVAEGKTGHIVGVNDHRPLARCLAQIDTTPAKYRAGPGQRPVLRSSDAQGADLAALYRRILDETAQTP